MSDRSRRVAAWSASVVALALVAGVMWLLWQVSRPGKQQMTTVVLDGDKVQNERGMRMGRPDRPAPEAPRWFQNAARRWSDADAPEGVRQLLGSYWRVKASNLIMEVEKRGEAVQLSFRYLSPDFVTPELRALHGAAREVRNVRPRGLPNLSPQQMEQLKAIPVPEGAVVSAADREQAMTLWKAWESASDPQKPAAEKALVAGLTQIAQKNIESTKQAYTAFADKVRPVFTPEQIEALLKSRQGAR